MNWSIVFVGLVVLLVAISIGMGWWQRTVERERRAAAQRQRRVFEPWQESAPDAQDPAGGNQQP
jgi:uncharacterized iron-regulated membrane protein